MDIVSYILGSVHVATRETRALAHVVSKLKGGRQAFRALPRSARRELVRAVLIHHNNNRAEYNQVMHRTRPARCPFGRRAKAIEAINP